MVEFVFELLFEGVLTFVVEALGGLLSEGVTRTLRSRLGRLVASATFGGIGGWLWGAYLRNAGHTALPRTLWVSLTFAVAGAGAAFALRKAGVDAGSDEVRLLPWRWTPHQWEAFALLNALVAAGVLFGFGEGAAA